MKQQALTQYPEGSLRELWSLSFPLMLSTLAALFMIFTDRIFLAHYSVEALNASVNSGTLAWALMAGFAMVSAMSEVFVAQYNGAGKYEKIGSPVWQMIWFAFFSCLFFIPMAIWGGEWLFSGDRYADFEIGYFRWLMIFSPSYVLLTAFIGFFIGRGETKLLIWLALFANLINIVLDWVLIFGIEGWIPEMGIEGAAIATCFGYLFESLFLGALFLKKKNRDRFGTMNFRLSWSEMKRCLKVGVPQGIFYTLEVVGWALFYWMMTSLSEKHITISSICQSFTILLSFFADGLSRGAAAVAGNLIGGKRAHLVNKVLKSGLILLAIFSFFAALVLLADPVDIVSFLFFEGGDPLSAPWQLDTSLKICMVFAFLHLFFDGIRWILGGLLAAAGDTLFLLIFGSISVWLFLLAPLYFFVVKQNLDVEYAWGLTVIYTALFFIIYLVRFLKGKWQQINLLDEGALADSEEDNFSQEATSPYPNE